MNRLLLACGVWAAGAAMLAAQPDRPRPERPRPERPQPELPAGKSAAPKGSEPIQLVFFRDQGPLVMRLHVLVAGQPVHARWKQYVERWFDYLDRHNRGALDEKELQGAPNAVNMRNLAAQGGFIPNRGVSLTLRDFGKSSEQTITRDEFIGYYKKNGVVPIQMTMAPIAGVGRANDALFKKLDVNGDGALSQAEVEAGRSLAAAFDVNDDELVSAQELAPGTAPVGGRIIVAQPQPPSTPAQSGSYFHVNGEAARVQLAFLLLARYDKNTNKHLSRQEIGFDEAAFAKLDKNNDGALDVGELAHVSTQAPFVELIAHVRGGNQFPWTTVATSLPPQAVRADGNQAVVSLSDANITVQNLDSGQNVRVFNQFMFIAQQIKAADTKNRGYVELKDLDSPQLQFVRQLFPILDRDEDGKLTDKETQSYFDLQNQARDVFASFSVLEEGRNWLQLIDANRDGQLAPRELLNAWTRLKAHDKNGDGSIDARELPQQFKVALNSNVNQQFVVVAAGASMRGSGPASAAYPREAPLWFRKMDRNGDGDVSRREFLGAAADFERLDANRDGLLDAAEAATAIRKQ